MDDDEYERLRWDDVDRQSIAYEQYKNTLAGQLELLLQELALQTLSLEQAAAGLERALEERRAGVDLKWKSESESKAHRLLIRAKEAGFGDFASFEPLWSELQKAEPWERSLRRDLYDDWISFQHHFDQDYFAELSVETDSLLRYGGVIAAYAILETYVSSFSGLLQHHGLPPRRAANARSKAPGELRRSRELIERSLGEKVAAGSWAALDVFILMRHCIAHGSGVVDDRLAKHERCFGPGKIAEIQYGKLVLLPSSVVAFLRAIHCLFDELSEAACRRGNLRVV